MAKHKAGKSVSKGLRRSSINAGKCKERSAITAERVGTAMRDAMLDIQLPKVYAEKSKIVSDILTAAGRNAGNNLVGRGWTANLSPRTVRALTEQGVFG